MIAIRVASSCGLGHIMRCRWLIQELNLRQEKVVLFYDALDSALKPVLSALDEELDVVLLAVYSEAQDWLKNGWDAIQDAQLCLRLLGVYPEVQVIVVDHYELGVRWEEEMARAGITVHVIDDLERQHYCDKLFDCKQTYAARYSDASGVTRCYLGAQYTMLSPDYRLAPPDVVGKEVEPVVIRENQVLFCLGGGGDIALLQAMIKPLLLLESMAEVRLTVVIGPMATNYQGILALSDDDPRLDIIMHPKSLSPYYRSCRLFVGALGTSLYELAATHTPALTFPLAVNQENSIEDLEQLGHFFHLDVLPDDKGALAQTIATLYHHSSELSRLRQQAEVGVDGFGAQRVAELILGGCPRCEPDTHTDLDNSDVVYQVGDFVIRPCRAEDVNRYLKARNRQDNAKRMTISREIARHEHYHWWFNNQRNSFVLEKKEADLSGTPLLYIWHQACLMDNARYLYGGWFAASDEVSFDISLMALKWQLDYTKECCPRPYTWLAVIHKDNKFVNLMNRYMGFKEMSMDSHLIDKTQSIFPDASERVFNFCYLSELL